MAHHARPTSLPRNPSPASSSSASARSGLRNVSPTAITSPSGAKSAAARSVAVRIVETTRERWCWNGVTTTPARAAAAASATSRSSVIVAPLAWIASIPSKKPGVATVAGPMWNACVAVPKSASTPRASAPSCRRSIGVWAKKSRTVVSPLSASRIMAKPPAPGAHSTGSHTHAMASAAIVASNAFPPRRSAAAPASAVS